MPTKAAPIHATSFRYLDTWSHVAWIGAALVGMMLIVFLPVHYLLFGIAPFAVIAYFVALKAPKDSASAATSINAALPEKIEKISLMGSYSKAIREWSSWNTHMWLLCVLIFFSSIVSALMYFFIPIDAYLAGANLPLVVLITIFGAIPALFGYNLGAISGRRN